MTRVKEILKLRMKKLIDYEYNLFTLYKRFSDMKETILQNREKLPFTMFYNDYFEISITIAELEKELMIAKKQIKEFMEVT